MFDIIGDIHGYARTLEALLIKIGYRIDNGYYMNPNRKAIFVGDFIDRGPYIRETLQIVKGMVDNGAAYAILGNHEYNAICFNTKSNTSNEYLRAHSRRNIMLHKETIDAFTNYQEEWITYLKWFEKLPLFIDNKHIRVVHACWDNSVINYIKDRCCNSIMDHDFLLRSAVPGTVEYKSVEIILKGYEIFLPPGFYYCDRDGNSRTKIRVRWWKSFNSETYRSISLSNDESLPEIEIPKHKLTKFNSYTSKKKPVFFGHYWRTGKPEILKTNVCCVDYSIARREKLVAYQWSGEKELDNNHYITQKCID